MVLRQRAGSQTSHLSASWASRRLTGLGGAAIAGCLHHTAVAPVCRPFALKEVRDRSQFPFLLLAPVPPPPHSLYTALLFHAHSTAFTTRILACGW